MLYLWTWMRTLGVSLRHRDEGATMVEYGLMVALIAIAAMAAVYLVGQAVSGNFSDVADQLGG